MLTLIPRAFLKSECLVMLSVFLFKGCSVFEANFCSARIEIILKNLQERFFIDFGWKVDENTNLSNFVVQRKTKTNFLANLYEILGRWWDKLEVSKKLINLHRAGNFYNWTINWNFQFESLMILLIRAKSSARNFHQCAVWLFFK